MSGAWIEYKVQDKYLQEFADSLGHEDPLHITIVYFGRKLDEDDVSVVRDLLIEWVNFFPKKFIVEGLLPNFNVFNSMKVQRIKVPERIRERRLFLLRDFYVNGIQYHDDYDWNPHVTVGKFTDTLYERATLPMSQFTLTEIKSVRFHHDFGDEYDIWSLE